MSALLDVSEGGFDTSVVPEPVSPARSHWSLRSHRTATLLPPSPSAVSPASGKSRGWRTPESSAPSSPMRSRGPSPISPPGQASILCLLRSHFLDNVDADGSGHFTKEELFDHIKELLERTSTLGSEDLELLGEQRKCRFSEMDLGTGAGQQGLGMDEWVHFMLLRDRLAPSKLQKLQQLQVHRDGLLRLEKWPAAFEAVGMSQPPDEILEDREEDGSPWALGYYEFLAHALGLKASVVELVLYDLSQGVAQWIPGSLLGGHKLDGVWHSGLRVFGKEFWFGGVILESKYEDVPFGVPKQVIRLGTTLRTYEDMVEFLKEDIYVDYNPRSYDVLRRNCNHFANELAQFLLHGKQLPDEVGLFSKQ
ncbi:desi1 [Symbiodinium pilosum]|uniref:Desi1 protein n=1 Tax=Symbiodinium pilosum TaxID=2952 RepID=A0A812J3S9_SYMPI|nr:desi1 [Symbiodinium pilosum]